MLTDAVIVPYLYYFSRTGQANKNALLRARLDCLMRPVGLEPTTTRLGRGDSTSELRALMGAL